MLITNKLDKSFGPVGSSAGYLLLVAGGIATFSSLFGLVLVIIGAFFGFTSTCTITDYENKRVKFSEKFFGIIPTGKWMPVDPSMKIGIKHSNQIWTAYSRSNQSMDFESKDFRLILFDSGNSEIMPIKKNDSPEKARADLEILCKMLDIKAME